MPVIGPNCYGFINYLDRALLWPDQHGGVSVARGVAIVTQSSNIAINMTMQRRALPIAYVATAGNQAQLGISEIAGALLDDERVTAIGLHIEGIDDVTRFHAMALRARALGKPIIALTVGRSEQSRAATVSHTASLAGSETGSAAFFSRLGIPRLRSIPEFLETLKLLHVHGALKGGDIASMSCSGGEASIMADAAAGRSIRFRPLTPEEKARVGATLSELVAIANPLDYHTFVWAKEAEMERTFAAMLGCGFALSLLVLDFPRSDRCGDADWDVAVRAIGRAAASTGAPTAVVATLPENMPEDRAAEFLAAGIVPLCGIEEALAAAEAAAFIGAQWKRPAPEPIIAARASEIPSRLIDEAEAKALLAKAGVPVPDFRVVRDAACAVAAAEALGYPVALKALGLAHKSEAGAVRLNLDSPVEVEAAARAVAGLGNGLLIEKMVTGTVAELLVGITRDPHFGLLLTIGAGGVLVELLGDSVSLLLPATVDEMREAMLSLKTAPLLQGFRGRPAADIDAAIDAVQAMARFAEANAGRIDELEINPLLVRASGEGVAAVDALIRMRAG
jgi:acyl-CoA synthetase (NDP forming)